MLFFLNPWMKLSGSLPEGAGEKIPGDKDVAPTRWWNHPFLAFFRWKTAVVFPVREIPENGYYVGFKDVFGNVMISMYPLKARKFAMKMGYEDCTFFVLSNPRDPTSLVTLGGYYRTTIVMAKADEIPFP